jgi:hypothetical protein
MGAFKIYSPVFDGQVLPGGGLMFANFIISLQNQASRIHSIIWTWHCSDGLSTVFNKYNNVSQEIGLSVTATNLQPVASPVNVLAPLAATYNGITIELGEPGYYYFESLYAQNDITISYNHLNLDAITKWLFHTCIAIEVETL